jgi:hypothetical protein
MPMEAMLHAFRLHDTQVQPWYSHKQRNGPSDSPKALSLSLAVLGVFDMRLVV